MEGSRDEIMKDDVVLRPMNCELNPLSRSDGSALLTQGETAVLASVHGPVEVKQFHNLQIEKATIEVCFRPKVGFPTVTDRMREEVIRNTFETALLTILYPRTAIMIQLQELENHSGLEACAINAACLSLLIAGISMKFTVSAIHCIIDKNSEIILDPDRRQASEAIANFTFAFDSIKKDLVTVNTNGKFNMAQYNDAMTVCRAASDVVFKFYKSSLQKFSSCYQKIK